jgi:hypothetical protein
MVPQVYALCVMHFCCIYRGNNVGRCKKQPLARRGRRSARKHRYFAGALCIIKFMHYERVYCTNLIDLTHILELAQTMVFA